MRRSENINALISNPGSWLYNLLKRTIDIGAALVLLVLSSPLQALISLYLMAKYRGNPIYRQKRGLTLENRTFTIYKFRTMRYGADNVGDAREVFQKTVPVQIDEDVCHWLRKTGLDELPQLINIIRGEMAFIGPRPLSVTDLELIKREKPLHYQKRGELKSKPGVSGFWQIFGDRSLGIENLLELDFFYEKNKSFLLDLFLVLKTIPVMMMANHSDALLGQRDVSAFFSGTFTHLIIKNS